MIQHIVLKGHSVSAKLVAVIMALAVMAALLTTFNLNFNIAGVVPNLSAEAILAGLVLAVRAYHKGASIRRALQIVFAWNVVSIIIWLAGDALVWLLENNITWLAKM